MVTKLDHYLRAFIDVRTYFWFLKWTKIAWLCPFKEKYSCKKRQDNWACYTNEKIYIFRAVQTSLPAAVNLACYVFFSKNKFQFQLSQEADAFFVNQNLKKKTAFAFLPCTWGFLVALCAGSRITNVPGGGEGRTKYVLYVLYPEVETLTL